MRPLALYFMRHGSTALTGPPDRFCGTSDPVLTPEGRAQVARLAVGLKGLPAPTRILTSRLLRAEQSAQIIAQTLQVPVQFEDLIREADFGRWEGLTREEVRDRFPEEFVRWDGDMAAPPGGTPVADLVDRSREFLASIAHETGAILIVSHKTFLRAALCTWLGVGINHHRSVYVIQPAGLGCVRFSSEGARLVLLNWVPSDGLAGNLGCA